MAAVCRATIRAATDVGGTFTDLVYFFTDPATGAQEIVTAKADTTPPDFERGVMDVLGKSGVSLDEFAYLAHGTTLVITDGYIALVASGAFSDPRIFN